MLFLPWMCTSSWQGGEASVAWSDLSIRIDTGRLTGRLVNVPHEEATANGLVVQQQHTFARSGVRLRVVEIRDGSESYSRLLATTAGKFAVLVEKATLCFLYPAPNRALVAAGYREVGAGGETRDRILVVNADGKVVARTEVGD
jgi:hypothetical protein